jgi:hypothetical protein
MKMYRVLLPIVMFVLSASTMSAQGGKVACVDGSKSAGGRGACSGHGGIMTAAKKAEAKADVKAAKAEKKADVKAAKAEKKADVKAAKAEKKADAKAGNSDETNSRGATAECKDHTYSHAKTHKGACSRHGGVARFLDGK